MRRRLNIDCGRLKRLPSKKSRVTDSVQGSSYLHWKLVLGWLTIILLDSMVDFRFEYLYPAVMFIRSVYDSYKYQGLIFSLLFICLVVYLDLLCWTVLSGPWLFLGASSCVWLEMMRNTDHSFSYTTLSLWMLFIYIEISHRLHNLPQQLLNVSRPFAAHCIGYPVVTVSFLIKHQITHIIRQRQQKRVAEENTFYFDVLQKALPQEEGKLTEEGHREKTDDSAHSSDQKGEQKAKISPKPPAGTKNMHKTQSTSGSRHTRGGSVNRSQDQKVSMNAKPPLTPHDTPKENGVHAAGVTPEPVANGDIVRPSSAGKIHTASGRRQAAVVRAVPRSDPPSPSVPPHLPMAEAEDKTKLALELLQAEYQGETLARTAAEAKVEHLELQVKKLQADLHASCLQEEETASRVDQLASQEKSHKQELLRLRTESDSLTNKLAKMSSGKQHNMEVLAQLERQLKHETDLRLRMEAELREHCNAVQNSWSEEEVRELQGKLKAQEKSLEVAKKELEEKERKCEAIRKELAACRNTLGLMDEERTQLKAALADETRVKIELFTALSDSRRKQQILVDELRRKGAEIDRLRQNLAEIIAILPGPTNPPPSTSPRPQH